MAFFQARTDLALEAREYVEDANGELRGIIVEEYEKKDTIIKNLKSYVMLLLVLL
mgnify:CR=1 FL=1